MSLHRGGLPLTLDRILTFGRVSLAELVAYRAEMLIWVLSATMPLVMLAIWDAAVAEGPVRGWGQVEVTRYFVVNLVVRHLTSAWVVWELNHMIRTGGLSMWLLRPMHPAWWSLAETLAAWPLRLVILAPLLAVLVAWRPELLFLPSLVDLLAFALSVVLALWLAWSVQAAFALLAFWVDQSMGFFAAWVAAWGLLSGYLVPTALLPAWIEPAARWLPFHSTLGAPVEILLGTATIGETLLVQAGWGVLTLALLSVMWRRGIVRYGAVGA